MKTNRKLWVVVYRTGGTVNFEWHRSVAFDSKEAAAECYNAVLRGGRHAMVVDYHLSMAIGLPETYGPNDPISGGDQW